MTRRMIVMLLATGLVLSAIFGWKAFVGYQMQKAMASMEQPVITVSAVAAATDTWTPVIPAVGSLRALQGVDVTAQIAGQIVTLNFESGQTVAAGELLVQQYIADDQAELKGLRADTKLAQTNFDRASELVDEDLVSDTEYDTRFAELQRARAAEENLLLVIEQKSIRAPFAGRLGIRKVDVGEYVEPGDTLVRLESMGQMLVDFPVPQRYLAQLSVGQPVRVRTDAWPGQVFSGRIRALEPQINRDTRTVLVEAIVDSAGEQLMAGMFARIEIELPAEQSVVTVPQSAVVYSPYGDSVFLVAEDEGGVSVARNVSVTTGATRGDQVAIEQGLEPGMVVVVAGQQKLRNGTPVQIDNSVAISAASDPSPANN